MTRLEEMEADPRFAKLNFSEQLTLRSQLLQEDERFAALAPQEQAMIYDEVVKAPPVLENKKAGDVRGKVSDLVRRMKVGDPVAVDEAVEFAAWRNGTKQMLLPTLVGRGVDAVMQLFDDDRDPLVDDFYGKDGEKLTQWLEDSVATYGGENALGRIKAGSAAIGIGGNIAEFMLTGLASKGVLTGASLSAKLAEKAAKVVPGTWQATKLALAGQTAEATIGGFTQTAFDVLRRGLQQETLQPQKAEFWGQVARDYGVNVLADYVMWGALRAASVPFKAAMKSVKGYDEIVAEGVDAANAQTIFDEATMPLTKQMSPAFYAEQAQQEARRLVADLDPRSVQGLDVLARSAPTPYAVKPKGKTFEFMHATDDAQSFEVPDLKAAQRKVAELYATGAPSSSAPDATFKKLGAANMENTKLVRDMVATLSDEAPESEMAKLLVPQNGFFQQGAVEQFARSWLRKQGMEPSVAGRVKVLLDDAPRQADAWTIVLPRSASSLQTELDFNKKLGDRLVEIAGKKGTLAPAVESGLKSALSAMGPLKVAGSLSHEGIAHLAAMTGQAFESVGAGAVKIGGKTFNSMAEAQAKALGDAIAQGKIAVDQVSAILEQSTGYTLRAQEVADVAGRAGKSLAADEATTHMQYQIGRIAPDASGHVKWQQFASAESIEDLFKQHPELDVRIPSNFAPAQFIVDPKAKKIITSSTEAVGPSSQLLRFMNDFHSPLGSKTLYANKDGSIVKIADDIYVENKELGVSEKVGDIGRARAKLTKWDNEWNAASDAAAMKGYKLRPQPDGTIAAVGRDGTAFVANSHEALKVELAKRAEPKWIKDYAPMPADAIREAERQAAKAAKSAEKEVTLKRSAAVAKSYLDYWGKPREMFFADAAKLHGDTKLVEGFRQVSTGFRAVQVANQKGDVVIDGFMKGLSYEDGVKAQYAVQWPETVRAERFRKVFGEEMSPKITNAISGYRNYMDEAFKAAGLPNWQYLEDFSSRVRKFVQDNPDYVLDDTMRSGDLLGVIYGPMKPVGFEFFAENLRATDLVNLALEENLGNVAKAYTYALNKKRVMDPIVKAMQKDLNTWKAEAKFSTREIDAFNEVLQAAQGGLLTPSERRLREMSLKLSQMVTNTMRKMPLLARDGVPEPVVIDDALAAINRQMSLTTQGTRPWVLLRNFFDLNRLGAVAGMKTVWSVAKEVAEEDATKSIQRVIKSGVAERSTDPMQLRRRTVWHKMMKWNENMDIYSRAVAMRTAEVLTEKAGKRLEAGLIDPKRFVRESGISILDTEARQAFEQAWRSGDRKLANDILGTQLSKLTLYDYSSIQKTPMQNYGIMGKLFGKFSVHPISSIALYGRMATSGDASEKVLRLSRMALSSVALYEGFKALGVDYQGFLWSDPFGFQGGPMWDQMVNGTKILDQGPEGAMARAALKRSLPTLLSPELAMMRNLSKSLDYLEKDDVISAAYALNGAPVFKATNQ